MIFVYGCVVRFVHGCKIKFTLVVLHFFFCECRDRPITNGGYLFFLDLRARRLLGIHH